MELIGNQSELSITFIVIGFSREKRLHFNDLFSLGVVVRLTKLIILLTRVLRNIGVRGLENEFCLWRLSIAIHLWWLHYWNWLCQESLWLDVVTGQAICWDAQDIPVRCYL